MTNVFISHAEEDALVAKEIASAFEGCGYSTWYFERDTLPGVAYLDQVANAIDQADAFLLLISPLSLAETPSLLPGTGFSAFAAAA